jgi:hypothetical protein
MSATTRWVLFDSEAETLATGVTNQTISGTGTQGYVEGSSVVSGPITILGGVSDQLQVSVNGGSFEQITLTAGADLDCRTVARDISFKLKQLVGSQWDTISCDYVNNKFRITSSSLGTNSSVSVDNGTNDCLHLLGMAASQGGVLTVTTVNGQASGNNASYTGQMTVGGQYRGQIDDVYTLLIGTGHPTADPVAASGNIYAGTAESAGTWNESTDESYTITVDTTNGATMNNGTGNCPTITWTSTQGDNSSSSVEVLYSDYWYNIGTKGLRVRFTDLPFGDGDQFTVACTAILEAAPSQASAAVGVAQYVAVSLKRGKIPGVQTTAVGGTAVGAQGVTAAFSASGNLTRRDRFKVICAGPQPTTLGATVLDFEAVTVSTYSPTRVVWFELVSGAAVLSSTKFGLHSSGSFQHHNAGNLGTKFGLGISGLANPGSDGSEWKAGILGNVDLNSDIPPAYLAATKENLSEAATAGESEVVGVIPGDLVTDFIYLAIKLDANEIGANSTIVYRMYFDYS